MSQMLVQLSPAEEEILFSNFQNDVSMLFKIDDSIYNYPNDILYAIGLMDEEESGVIFNLVPINPAYSDYQLAICTYEMGEAIKEENSVPSM